MSSASGTEYALLYLEPDALTILILSAFLLAGNVLNFILDGLIYCGLIGQILVGIAFGNPGGKLLTDGSEELIVNLGYVGLILLVYEGGLSTNLDGIRHNLVVSLCVCLTGVVLPISLSYVLLVLVNASPLQAFAAGAALCSTSLGTTFTILASTGLQHTRIGIVLKSAAMLDDVVGLIMVQIIMNLGTSQDSFSAVTIIRPIFVAVGFVVGLFVVARFVVAPCKNFLNGSLLFKKLLAWHYAALVLQTAFLVGLTTAASYAGTSNLYAAFLAGVTISWWDEKVEKQPSGTAVVTTQTNQAPISSRDSASSGQEIYEHFNSNVVKRVLQPFFFASIGFSIPITRLWSGSILWRGIVYAILMLIAKLFCGVWLLRIPDAVKLWASGLDRHRIAQSHADSNRVNPNQIHQPAKRNPRKRAPSANRDGISIELRDRRQSRGKEPATSSSNAQEPTAISEQTANPPAVIEKPKKPVSLYPSCIVGLGMVARGEIGFLISAIAEKQGLFGSSGLSETYLVVTWAILLCTIVGPLGVGLITRRVKKLQAQKDEGSLQVLGDWGLEVYDPVRDTVGCNGGDDAAG